MYLSERTSILQHNHLVSSLGLSENYSSWVAILRFAGGAVHLSEQIRHSKLVHASRNNLQNPRAAKGESN